MGSELESGMDVAIFQPFFLRRTLHPADCAPHLRIRASPPNAKNMRTL